MKRIAALCALSALLGGAASFLLSGNENATSQAVAQGAREPAYSQGGYPPPASRGYSPVPVPPAQPAPAFGLPPAGPASVAPAQSPYRVEPDEYTPEEKINIAVYEAANRSVVNITTKGYLGDRVLFVEVPSEGEGSGAVLDRQGHIVTNNHVIEDAQEIQITLFNGKTYEGTLVGRDRDTDVAVVKVEAPADELFPVALGDSTRLRVGQRVFALGNPFGLERTLSTGIVSSLDRFIPSRSGRKIRQIIQIDASINPGSSGGPLLDSRARMIGMNTAIASKTGESAGVGFAIPVSTIRRIVPQLIQDGRVIRPETGIERVIQTEQGLLIATMTPDGPAKKAGLQGPKIVRKQKRQGPFVYEYRTIDPASADMILSVDGQPIKTADDFLTVIEAKLPGQQVTLNILRNGREMQIPLTLDASGS